MSATNDGTVSYALNDGYGEVMDLEADWAEPWSETCYFREEEQIFQMPVTRGNKNTKFGAASELANFTDMKFEAIEAPPWATKW